jgi:hypothetical protein
MILLLLAFRKQSLPLMPSGKDFQDKFDSNPKVTDYEMQ